MSFFLLLLLVLLVQCVQSEKVLKMRAITFNSFLSEAVPKVQNIGGLKKAFQQSTVATHLEQLTMPVIKDGYTVIVPFANESYFDKLKSIFSGYNFNQFYQMGRGEGNTGRMFHWLISNAPLANWLQLSIRYVRIPKIQITTLVCSKISQQDCELGGISLFTRYAERSNGTFLYSWETGNGSTGEVTEWREELFLPMLLAVGQSELDYLEQYVKWLIAMNPNANLEMLIHWMKNNEIRSSYERILLNRLAMQKSSTSDLESEVKKAFSTFFGSTESTDEGLKMNWHEFEKNLCTILFQLPRRQFNFDELTDQTERFVFSINSYQEKREKLLLDYVEFVYYSGEREWNESELLTQLRKRENQHKFSSILNGTINDESGCGDEGKELTIAICVSGAIAVIFWIWLQQNKKRRNKI